MLLIYSFISVIIFSIIFSKNITKYSKIFYSLAGLISIITIIYETFKMVHGTKLSGFIYYLEKTSIKGIISVSFFILVMYAGALSTNYSFTKKLLKMRAELAIIASILLLPHGIIYTIKFFLFSFKKVMSNPSGSMAYLGIVITGLIGLILMIPLFITSFKKIRRKMSAYSWKKLQKKSYIFYFLTYLHIMIIGIKSMNWINISTYSTIFMLYTILRILKYNKDQLKRVKKVAI
ncbi:ferric reductase-like transmembrane domain-containing protein [Clostridium sp. Marseille-Q2269]|uniref:ferric reductase-like transmembrane domain-containing protein n=1 Tax=Clostridium sp. Marseille-Q2269 TaxID=2942205 RepID=UPI0033659AC4